MKILVEEDGARYQERTYEFALAIVRLNRSLQGMSDMRITGNQVLRAGCSVGAHVEEAQSAHSKKDLIYRILIALREARETHYWLRLIHDSTQVADVRPLIDEAEELKKILGAIGSKSRGSARSRSPAT